jgi:hypothetical protein
MGTLDDAIREHLELKKRLGASEEEIERKQSEAFGKGTRPAPPPAESEPAAAEPAPEPDHSFVADELAAAEPAPNGRSAQGGIETVEWEPPREAVGDVADEIFEPDEVPPEESLDPMTLRDERHVSAEDSAGPTEDVLEETPEFLEETPEHDRLWFEQRPPKDFDFD